MGNEHCKLNFYVAQFVTGHICFKKYLHTFRHDTFPICPNCVNEEEGAEHNLMCCARFKSPGEISFEPNRLMGEALNSVIVCTQYSQRMAEVILELQRMEV